MSESDEEIVSSLSDTPADISPTHAKLLKIRERKDLEARPSSYMRESFTGFDGNEHPLKLRYYQVQGVMHLLACTRFLLGDDTGLGKCAAKSVPIITDRGMMVMGELGPWETMAPDTFIPIPTPTKVWTGWEWAPVKHFYFGGVKPTLKLTTRRGYEITVSRVHPLWCRRESGGEEFVQAQDLSIGAVVVMERKLVDFPVGEPSLPTPDISDHGRATKSYSLPSHLSPDLAAFLAYVVAEGNRHPGCVIITQDNSINPETHDHIRQLAETLFGWAGNQGDAQRDTRINISSVLIKSYLEGLGVAPVLSAQKSVPWPIFRGTRESVAAFLRSFFDSEGSVGDGVVEVSSASEQLLREIQVLLLRFGVVCTRHPKKVKGYNHTYWRLALCGDDLRAFKEHIGFLTPRKQQALDDAASKESNTNLDVVPHARELVEAIRSDIFEAVSVKGSNGERKGSGLKKFGVSFEKTLNGIRNDGRNPTYSFLVKLAAVAQVVGADKGPAYGAVRELIHNHFFYDPIVSIEEGEEEVMDIEVDHSRHSFVAGGFVSHNTLMTISALTYLWERNSDQKVIILTSKSAVEQWAGEFRKFTKGITTFVSRGTPVQRRKIREKFISATGPTVLVMGYRTAVQDFSDLQNEEGYVLVTDEAAAYKNHQTQVHQVCKWLSGKAVRTWALTATLIKNNLVEGWGVYNVVVPGLFGSHNAFLNDFCITRMQQLPGSRRQVPVIVGYRQRDIVEFRRKIDPYFLGRPKFEVASELPPLVTRHIMVGMNPAQKAKYEEALEGLLVVGEKQGQTEEKEVTKLTAVTYCQQIVNHPDLIGVEGDSEKLDALLDLVGAGGELEGEKVIVFTRFRKMVDILVPELKKIGIKASRITGAEDEKERKASQDAFQNSKSDTLVCCITTAAAEAINLQSAKALVFYDTPWSAGDYLQILGRMIRIGSTHDRCYAIHLVTEKTIDERVVKVLSKKMGLVESVLGKRIKGEGDAGVMVDAVNDLSDLFDGLLQDARGIK
jgi:intein/homing endonuclease